MATRPFGGRGRWYASFNPPMSISEVTMASANAATLSQCRRRASTTRTTTRTHHVTSVPPTNESTSAIATAGPHSVSSAAWKTASSTCWMASRPAVDHISRHSTTASPRSTPAHRRARRGSSTNGPGRPAVAAAGPSSAHATGSRPAGDASRSTRCQCARAGTNSAFRAPAMTRPRPMPPMTSSGLWAPT